MKMFNDDIQGYRRLLTSVIWLAAYDACTEPVRIGPKGFAARPSNEAASAIRFIFDDYESSYFEKYLHCLNMDVGSFRHKMLETMYHRANLRPLPFGGLPKNAQRNFKFNHTHWLTYGQGDMYEKALSESTGLPSGGSPLQELRD